MDEAANHCFDFRSFYETINLSSVNPGERKLRREREEKKMRRTTHRSVAGKKLYAVRDAKGRFMDIQTYERAHRMDLKKKSRKEAAKGKTK